MLIIIYLFITIGIIVFATAKYKIHPFLILILASLIMGLLGGLDTEKIIISLSEGFGNTLKNIGIVIACGSIIGVFLENAHKRYLNAILDKVSKNLRNYKN